MQFVGFMGAFRAADAIHPMLAGAAGAVVVTWVTFVPCVLWIFLGAPHIEYLRGNRHLTAAVVDVVPNLAVWFSLHDVFADVDELRTLGVRLYQPDLGHPGPGRPR